VLQSVAALFEPVATYHRGQSLHGKLQAAATRAAWPVGDVLTTY
jgi:hypothetical protein